MGYSKLEKQVYRQRRAEGFRGQGDRPHHEVTSFLPVQWATIHKALRKSKGFTLETRKERRSKDANHTTG